MNCCPHCGHCPNCGRAPAYPSNPWAAPVHPRPYPHPWWGVVPPYTDPLHGTSRPYPFVGGVTYVSGHSTGGTWQ